MESSQLTVSGAMQRKTQLLNIAILLVSAVALAQDAPKAADPAKPAAKQAPAAPQTGDGQGRRTVRTMGGGAGTMGTITAISGKTLTVKDKDGKSFTVKTSDDTRFRNGMDEGSLKELKVGGSVVVRGEADGDSAFNALFVISLTAEQLQQFQTMMQGGNGQMMGNMNEQLGKTLVVGKITAIDEVKITVDMPNQKSITFEVDENTSFKKDNQSVTLADFKVGDGILARGALNSAGTFVAKEMSAGGLQFRRNRTDAPPPDKPKQ